MDYTKRQKEIYIRNSSDQPTTFQYDSQLNKLPIPPLQQTIDKYLKSIIPFVSQQDYETSKTLCQDFIESGQGQRLENLIRDRAKECDNWLDDWWLRKAYLQFREPLIPLLNTAGPFAANNPGGAWQPDIDPAKPIENVSEFVFHMMQFWKALRKEEILTQVSKKGTRFSMHQFRNLFNTTRIPRKNEDRLRLLWKTEKEGPVPQHAVVFR